ncbi:MAG: hypothetical protein DSY42_09535 [Aquifex sp.]|nr:MAG: hypothetical protein DSY42_09535 [Aquifex sp.]
MIPALLTSLIPLVADVIIKKVKEKAPDPVKQVINNIEKEIKEDKELQKEIAQIVLHYNEQLLKELEIRERYKTAGKFSKIVRPSITLMTFITFEVSMIYGVVSGTLSFSEFVNVFTPINSMILGFWFGERSALKDPRKILAED